MCTLFYHSSETQSMQELSTHSINRFRCHQPLCSAAVQSLFLSDLSAGSWWHLNGRSEARQVFRLSTAQDNVHLLHGAKNVATQASLIHLAKPKEAVRWICRIHQLAERVETGVKQTQAGDKVCGGSFNPLLQWLLPIRCRLISHIVLFLVEAQQENKSRGVD